MTRAHEAGLRDEDLVAAFEDCSHASLTHEEHVRLGYLYLRGASLPEVLVEFPRKLKRYATSRSTPGLYHETITWAFLFLIHERMHSGPNESWQAFANANPDLLESSILTDRHYRKEELDSKLARRAFVLPKLFSGGSGIGS